jgi:hypothetical protein
MTRNILHIALAFCLALLLSGCGFLLAPVAGTAATAAQLSVKGADKGIAYSKQAADKSIDLGRQAAGASAELGRSRGRRRGSGKVCRHDGSGCHWGGNQRPAPGYAGRRRRPGRTRPPAMSRSVHRAQHEPLALTR